MALLNVKETAEILRISEQTVYLWVSQKKIPHVNINGQLRFKKESIISFINYGEVPIDNFDNPKRRNRRGL